MSTNSSINLKTDIKYVKGVGPRRANVLKQHDIDTVENILKYYPRKYLDRTNIKRINQLKIGEQAVVLVTVRSFIVKYAKRKPYFQLTGYDQNNSYINCIWFNSLSWISDKFKEGDRVAFFGKIEFYQNLRIMHPEFDILDHEDDPINTGCIVPLYPSTFQLKKVGLDSRGIRKLILYIINNLNIDFEDYFKGTNIINHKILELKDAIRYMHCPKTKYDIKNALYRLKFNEHFYLQLIKLLTKKNMAKNRGKSFEKLGSITRRMYKKLDFQLTNAQIKVLKEIRNDLISVKPMNRLIQGDVGCGKTIVSIFSAAIVVDNKAQVAIMAPTEILAEQHFKSFSYYFNDYNVKCTLLLGNHSKKDKEVIYQKLNNGEIDIIIGTHALIQENVSFLNLGLTVIDEQHKFGVEQRKKIINKGDYPNILAMTATPIPRTLAFTIHGDMDISWIDEMPKNRVKIKTKVIHQNNIQDIYTVMRKEMDYGHQCYIVYPIISESEKIDAKDAETAYNNLSKKDFKDYSVGFMHGKLKKEAKDSLMNKFKDKKIDCLISTTVVEVGIDNPNATIMVIENAERFGLTQLHQLRGRIGRGSKKSQCFLIQRKENNTSLKRLKIMESNSDGFKISDEDLKLRGPGDFFGTSQHGYIKSGLINFSTDGQIIEIARKKAFEMISEDEKFCMPKNVRIKKELLENYKDMLEFIKIS